jgi:hypothetical protein
MRWARYVAVAVLVAVGVAGLVDPDALAQDVPKSKADRKAAQKKAKAEALRQKAAAAKAREAEEQAAAAAAKRDAERKAAERASKPRPSQKPAGELARIIDTHVDRKLAAEKVPASPICTDAEFLRRASLDITGVIPTAEEAKRFLDDPSPDKRARLVDELLGDPNYGRRQADLWMAKLFPRDSANRFVLREPFSSWLKDEFNKNTPWDEFAYRLMTATGTVAENPAVTWYLANRSVDKLTDGAAQHFLGLQLACAQCHNHPFTAWKQTEYWGMAAFFSKVQPQNPRNANKGGDNTQIGVSEGAARTRLRDFFPESTKTVPARFLGGPEAKLSERQPYRPALAEWMTSPENRFFARAAVNRTWALLFGHGIVDPVDDMHDGNEPSHPELLAELAREFAAGGFDLKHLIRGICASQAYQRSGKPAPGADPEHDRHYFARMTVKVMSPEQLFDSLAKVTGFTAARPGANRPMPMRGQPNGPREQFVQFFLAGSETANPVEYEAGIPQALRLMNSRIAGNPNAARTYMKPGAKPSQVIEEMYLATLSRRPTAAESDKLTAYVARASTPAEGYGDVLWALLNSSEFAMVR